MEEDVGNVDYDPQAQLLERAASLPLPDAAFAIVLYNYHHSNGASIDLSVLHGSYDLNEVEEWRVKAQKLRDDAYPVGDAALRDDGTYDLHRARYEAAHPGFMPKTYDDAVGFGIWQAR